MVNILGVLFSFAGTVITLLGILRSKPKEGSVDWDEFDNLGTTNVKNRKFTVWGLSIMSVGFLLQLYVAIVAL